MQPNPPMNGPSFIPPGAWTRPAQMPQPQTPPTPWKAPVRPNGVAYPILRLADVHRRMKAAELTGMVSEVMIIYPADAKAIHDKLNTNNRPRSKLYVRRYADRMTGGQWLLIAEGISFSPSKLNNGQHRLLACAESGVPMLVNVTFGEPEDAYKVRDTAKPRRPADALATEFGDKDVNNVATALNAIRNITLWQKNLIVSPRGRSDYTADDICQIRNHVGSMQDYSRAASRVSKGLPGFSRGGVMAALYVITHQSDLANVEDKVADFIEGLATGADLGLRDPRRVLREAAQNDARRKKERGSDIFTHDTHNHPIEAAALTILCWNAFVQNRQRFAVRWPIDHEFPLPI